MPVEPSRIPAKLSREPSEPLPSSGKPFVKTSQYKRIQGQGTGISITANCTKRANRYTLPSPCGAVPQGETRIAASVAQHNPRTRIPHLYCKSRAGRMPVEEPL
ncbi:MAG: hypothetical protein LBR08_11340 [Bacteroidales bacterium]|nr:hypothetical protein [Bacteroidales bacterium]